MMSFLGNKQFSNKGGLYLGLLLIITQCLQSYAGCPNNTLANEQTDQHNQINFVSHQHSLDNSCWIKDSEITVLAQKETITLVDVRSKTEQKALPLNGLLDIPLSALPNKQFLKQQPIVLVGTGFDQVMLNKACIQLKQAGFTAVYALEGGAYVLDKSQQQHYEITPEQYWSGSMASPWKTIVIDIAEDDLQALPIKPFKQLVSTTDNVVLAIHQTLSQFNQLTPIQLVLITQDQATTKHWQQTLNNLTDSKQIVWLQGGVQNYNDYINQQQSIRNNAAKASIRSCR
ncbi:rhodanese-like domain-containing protein [Entomomonas sp. E2T0]|uniref:rhodanese-like domain-containing protein n=1 Tax=Entomomonas sp. E2T0 TaxID=2930213 RepID=UPI00222846A0|nr:rhodanese-like domain-containing protein [Entomomonas sp. E2T0]UYZ83142.1 rhodanese-like domain-containing protein [Entomomonas sp. E2T0]